MKSSVFWGISACCPLKANRRFGEHVASIFQVEEYAKKETSVKVELFALLSQWFLLGIHFDPDDGGDMFLQNIR
jgi:hypothetical protein